MSILRIRRSQLISKHGVGSVFPGTDGVSRLTAGLDRWFSHEYEENNKNVHKDDFKINNIKTEIGETNVDIDSSAELLFQNGLG